MLLSRNCPPRTPSSSPTWIGTQPSGHGVKSHPVPHLLPIGGRRPNRLSRGSFLGNQRRSGGEHSLCYLSLTLSLSLSVQLLEPELPPLLEPQLPPLLEPELPPLLESELPPLLDSALLVRYGIFLVISLVIRLAGLLLGVNRVAAGLLHRIPQSNAAPVSTGEAQMGFYGKR